MSPFVDLGIVGDDGSAAAVVGNDGDCATLAQCGAYGVAVERLVGDQSVEIEIGDQRLDADAVTIKDDDIDEPDETFNLQFIANPGFRISATADEITVTIKDDDVPVAGISGPSSVREGRPATYAVSLDRSPSVDVGVDWAVVTGSGTADADAADFGDGTALALPEGTLTFAAGTTDLTREVAVAKVEWYGNEAVLTNSKVQSVHTGKD